MKRSHRKVGTCVMLNRSANTDDRSLRSQIETLHVERQWGFRATARPTALQIELLRRKPSDTETRPEQRTGAGHRRTAKMARVEAAMLIADGALSTRRLAHLATLSDAAEARQLIEELNAAYDECGSAFRIERVATGYQMLTRPVFASWLDKLHHRQSALKLSPPAMETLTIVAYRQPITRADVESVRGVQCTEMLKLLMERGLVRIGGEEDSLGRPYLYETTRKFLESFGLRNLDDLPMSDRLRRRPEPPSDEAADESDAEEEDFDDDEDEDDAEMEEAAATSSDEQIDDDDDSIADEAA